MELGVLGQLERLYATNDPCSISEAAQIQIGPKETDTHMAHQRPGSPAREDGRRYSEKGKSMIPLEHMMELKTQARVTFIKVNKDRIYRTGYMTFFYNTPHLKRIGLYMPAMMKL